MNFKQAVNKHPQLKAVYEHLIIKTSMGRDYLFNTEFSSDVQWLKTQYRLTQECQEFIAHMKDNDKMLLECVMYDIHNISGSINMIENSQTLDDIALFEIKAFCLSCRQLNSMLCNLKSLELIPQTFENVIDILDPEGLRTKQFYIYNAYHKDLEKMRNEFERLKLEDSPASAEIYNAILETENAVRQRLCGELRPYVQELKHAVMQIAMLDISIAKAELNMLLTLTKPDLNLEYTEYKQMFNPVIKEHLNKKGKNFQPIDIKIGRQTMLITGANMAGKTVILKTLILNQLLAQFGFFTACTAADICPVEDILFSIGDNQDENQGLSSFASEMLTLNDIVQKVKTQKRYLVAADELARTTNPIEGVKLLNGFISVVNTGNSFCVVTTHYSNINADCIRMRVKGFINKNLTAPISIANLSENIDYSLIEDNSDSVPVEALNLCRLLGIDKDWLLRCQ